MGRIGDTRKRKPDVVELAYLNSPTRYICPLNEDFMRDPYTILGGKTFEKEAIVAWLKGRYSYRCPVDGSYLISRVMHPEPALQQKIAAYVNAEPLLAVEQRQREDDFLLTVALREDEIDDKRDLRRCMEKRAQKRRARGHVLHENVSPS
jgi:hypothetical protein